MVVVGQCKVLAMEVRNNRANQRFSGLLGRFQAPDQLQAKTRDELNRLHAMGWETTNVHLGTKAVMGRVLKDLNQRSGKCLRRAAEVMAKATLEDWKG